MCSIADGNALGHFQTNTTDSKVIETAAVIEPDSPTNHPISYALRVTCVDDLANPGSSLTSTASVFVSVSLSNDHTPSIVPAVFNITV